jgi:hypothetical protein
MKTLQNLRNVFKTLKHQNPTQKYCPKCGSPKLTLSSSLDYWLLPQKYFCKECNYTGTIYMELEKEEEEKENPDT